MRTFSLKISASLAFALVATQAFAHAQLEKAFSAGRRNGSLGERDQAHLQRRRRTEIHQIRVTGPGGAVPLGAAKTESGNQAVLIVPIAKGLAAGVYKVHWAAVSVDTHHTQGTFEFTVKP